jgi:large subunit ribosomal protein L29
MKTSEIREMSLDEMRQQAATQKETYFNLRFQHETGQLENSSMLTRVRKDIARLKTVIKEKEPKTEKE